FCVSLSHLSPLHSHLSTFFFYNATAPTEIYTVSLHDALPISLGISLILQNGGLILFGSTPVGIRTPLSRQSWEIGDVLLNQGRVVSFLFAVALAGGMYLFLSHTRLGKGLRAAADNPQAAIYMGIDVDRA